MYSKNASATVGARIIAITVTGVIAVAVTATRAETVATINGTNIDSSVLEVYSESRTQKALADLTEQDRQTLISELVDLYILSTQPGAADLAKDPKVSAQLELQEHKHQTQFHSQTNKRTEEEKGSDHCHSQEILTRIFFIFS